MVRYIAIAAKPRADWSDDPDVADVSTRTVIIEDGGPIRTGLLDETGTPLYRLPNKIKMGFVKG